MSCRCCCGWMVTRGRGASVFSARPGTIKEIVKIDEPHPRKPGFVTTEKFARLRNTLYGLLHGEIRKAVGQTAMTGPLT